MAEVLSNEQITVAYNERMTSNDAPTSLPSGRSVRAIAINHCWGTAPTQGIVADSIEVEGF